MQAPNSNSHPVVATCTLLSHQEQWVQSSSVSPVHKIYCSLQVPALPIFRQPQLCAWWQVVMLVKLG